MAFVNAITKDRMIFCYILSSGPAEAHERTMTMILFFKIILMFTFFFGLIGFVVSPFMPLEKMEKVGGWGLVVSIVSLIGILILSKF